MKKDEAKLLTRCLELERLQLATEKLEESKFSKTRQYSRQRSASTALSKTRAQSARSARGSGSTKCAQDCVQVICVGDCPEKISASPCSSCHKKTCNGSCTPTPYSGHTRQHSGTQSIEPTKTRIPRPTSCGPCSKSNPAQKLNKKQTQLGRPRSSHSTYSQAKKSTARQTYQLHTTVQQLDINEPEFEYPDNIIRTNRVRSAKIRRGRDTIAPHKSYHSQRRVSLTANSIRPVYGVKLPSPKRRARSARSTNSNS